MRVHLGRRTLWAAIPVVVVGAVVVAMVSPTSATISPTDWVGYLDGPAHSSYNAADTTITATNVAALAAKWTFTGAPATIKGQPGPALYASPTVADGAIYIGANTGWFYQLDENTGAVLHKVFLGYRPALTCAARGTTGTATVALDSADNLDTVYVASADGYLYALKAADLTQKWRSVIDLPSSTVNDYFQWSSPTVANGKIYVGSASHCDKPLTRGAIVGFNQSDGTQFARFSTVPAGILGGGVWSSVAVASDGNVYASTGTQPKNTTNRYDSVSIVRLDGTNLAKLGSFTVPNNELGGDSDFGGSPTVFGNMVGACNKNGNYYALDRITMKLIWELKIGAKSSSASPAQCSAAAIYDGTSLYMAGDPTTIAGVAYRGSVRRLNPATGAVIWALGLPNSILGAPTMNGGGVIATGSYDFTKTANAVYLVNSSNGQLLRTLSTGGKIFAQPVFANGYLFTANGNNSLTEYRAP